MKRFRAVVSAVAGLFLLAQGTAVAAATLPAHAAGMPPAAMADMPCHHAATPAAPKPRCCEPGCLGMAACASAHVAIASAAVPLPAPVAEHFVLVDGAAILPPPRIASLLRPPIALHG